MRHSANSANGHFEGSEWKRYIDFFHINFLCRPSAPERPLGEYDRLGVRPVLNSWVGFSPQSVHEKPTQCVVNRSARWPRTLPCSSRPWTAAICRLASSVTLWYLLKGVFSEGLFSRESKEILESRKGGPVKMGLFVNLAFFPCFIARVCVYVCVCVKICQLVVRFCQLVVRQHRTIVCPICIERRKNVKYGTFWTPMCYLSFSGLKLGESDRKDTTFSRESLQISAKEYPFTGEKTPKRQTDPISRMYRVP